MAQNELQKEFTQFVGQIIEQINKEIYMEDLKNIYESYTKCLENLKEETEIFIKTKDSIHENQSEVVNTISDIQQDFVQKTEKIEEALSVFYTGYENILQQYENQIVALNEKERANFTQEIQDTIQTAHDEKLKNIEDTFFAYTDRLQNMANSVAKAEDLEKIVSEMALTKESLNEFVSETYLETVTGFEKRIADFNVEERKALSLVVKNIFDEENSKLKNLMEEYSYTLRVIASQMMTHEDLEKFKQGLAQYSNRIQYIAEQRYVEVLRAFENSLSEMGKVQFEKYLDTINQTALKVSDLEKFLEQIKVLELGMKAQMKNFEDTYIQIFEKVKNGIEVLNETELQKCLTTISTFFSEQILLFSETFDRYQQTMIGYAQEQQDLLYEINKIERAFQKNEENNEKSLQALFTLQERENHFDDKMMDVDKKIANLESKAEEQMAKQQYMIKEIQNNRINIHALSVLNIIQFMIIIVLFFMSGDENSIFPKVVFLIILLIVGIVLLIRKKK